MSWRAALSRNLNELRVVYCATADGSVGTRQFVEKEYRAIKALNPGLPIYIRPCEGVEPFVAARYERGVYEKLPTGNKSSADVLDAVKKLSEMASEVNGRFPTGLQGGGTPKFANVI